MAFSIGQKLLASQVNDFNPSGDVNPGDDIALGTGGVITWNADTNLYREAADILRTDDAFRATKGIYLTGAVKSGNETVNNSATFQDDDEIVGISLDVTTYYFDLEGVYTSGATPGFKTRLVWPASTTGQAWGTGGTGNGFGNVSPTIDPLNWGGDGTDNYFKLAGRVVIATAGTVKLQWAQQTANASNTIIYGGAKLQLWRL